MANGRKLACPLLLLVTCAQRAPATSASCSAWRRKEAAVVAPASDWASER